MMSRLMLFLSLITLFVGTAPLSSQPPSRAGASADAGEGSGEGLGRSKSKIKPYDEIVTAKATSDEGVFTVHRDGDKVFYEIPKAELGAEFLWVTRISKTSDGLGNGGRKLGSRVVAWERQGDRILLREKHYDVFADPSLPVAHAVANSNTSTILQAFDIVRVRRTGGRLRGSLRSPCGSRG